MILPPDQATSTALRRHAGLLADVAGTGRVAAALDAGDAAPLAQAHEIHRALTRQPVAPLTEADARGVLAAVPRLSRAINATVAREVAAGRWLIPADTPTNKLEWTPALGVVPYLSARTATLASGAADLARTTGAPSPAAKAPRPLPRVTQPRRGR